MPCLLRRQIVRQLDAVFVQGRSLVVRVRRDGIEVKRKGERWNPTAYFVPWQSRLHHWRSPPRDRKRARARGPQGRAPGRAVMTALPVRRRRDSFKRPSVTWPPPSASPPQRSVLCGAYFTLRSRRARSFRLRSSAPCSALR
jgi:hypothetical protein